MAIPYYNDTVCLQRVIYICTEWRDAAFIKLGKLYNEKNLFICHRISLGFRYVSTKGCEGNN